MGHSLLIVEDEPAIAEALGEMLEDEGYTITIAQDGELALEALARGPAPDVILLDLMMPRVDGYEFRQRQLATAAFSEIPTIVLSATPPRRDWGRLLAAECLRKPIYIDTLIAAVKRCCDEAPYDHRVCFYEQDHRLVGEVAPFLADAIQRRGVGLAFCTVRHAAPLRAALAGLGCNIVDLEGSGQLVIGDAAAVLHEIVGPDGTLDEHRFRAAAGSMIDRAIELAGAGPVSAYGEMVNLLLQERGDAAGALRLEQLWNGLARVRRFSLLCSYHHQHDAGPAAPFFADICAQHSAVV